MLRAGSGWENAAHSAIFSPTGSAAAMLAAPRLFWIACQMSSSLNSAKADNWPILRKAVTISSDTAASSLAQCFGNNRFRQEAIEQPSEISKNPSDQFLWGAVVLAQQAYLFLCSISNKLF